MSRRLIAYLRATRLDLTWPDTPPWSPRWR